MPYHMMEKETETGISVTNHQSKENATPAEPVFNEKNEIKMADYSYPIRIDYAYPIRIEISDFLFK